MTIPDKVCTGIDEVELHYSNRNKGGRTFVVAPPLRDQVRRLRERLRMSQSQFAIQFGISIRTLQKWEQGESMPDGPTRAYLAVIEQNHEAVLDALRQSREKSVIEKHGSSRLEF